MPLRMAATLTHQLQNSNTIKMIALQASLCRVWLATFHPDFSPLNLLTHLSLSLGIKQSFQQVASELRTGIAPCQ